jgi:hypothetical protein
MFVSNKKMKWEKKKKKKHAYGPRDVINVSWALFRFLPPYRCFPVIPVIVAPSFTCVPVVGVLVVVMAVSSSTLLPVPTP